MAVNGDPAVTKFLPYATWGSKADAQAWYQRMSGIQAAGAALQFVVVERSSECAIGTALLFRFDEESGRAEIGYALAHAHWGKGYMQEAWSTLIDWAFHAASLRRLEAEVDPRNKSSTRLLLRLGFTKEGLLRERWITKGEATDVETFGLLGREWKKPR